jgi:hypothetical protein
MKFGLFSSAQANSNDLPPEIGQGFRDYLDFNVEAEAFGFQSSFLVEHHFTGWNQVSATLLCQGSTITAEPQRRGAHGGRHQQHRTAAPNSAACMCMPGGWRFPIFHGSEASPQAQLFVEFQMDDFAPQLQKGDRLTGF